MNKSVYDEIKKLKNPLAMFDMVIASAYFAGVFDKPIPVDESREVFEVIKSKLHAGVKSEVKG
jgi:hypothetical protein